MTNAAIVVITTHLLKHALGMNPDFVITGMEFDGFDQTFQIRIDHPSLPDVEEGSLPEVIDMPGSDRPIVVTEAAAGGAAPVTKAPGPWACEVQFSHTPKVQQYRAALQDSQVVGKAS